MVALRITQRCYAVQPENGGTIQDIEGTYAKHAKVNSLVSGILYYSAAIWPWGKLGNYEK